jgi:hypothetical protein
MMLSCKAATGLIEKKQILGLSLGEKVKLKLHLSLCSVCAAYEKQSAKIERLLQERYSKISPDHLPELENPELKTRIIQTLDKKH